MQNHNNNFQTSKQQQQQLQQQMQRASVHSSSAAVAATTTTTITNFTNTAKLPIETVKLLISSVARKPNLWIRTNNGQKRSDLNALWQQVGQEVHLPADICRIKWGHLRDNFRKVFIRNTLSSEPPTTWRFYNDMRFMEPAVAENVMRHHRLREQSLYWQGLSERVEARHNNTTQSTATLNDNYNVNLQNQFNFSELSSFFQQQQQQQQENSSSSNKNNTNNNHNKRIKLENPESETSLQDLHQTTPTPPSPPPPSLPQTNSFFSHDNNYTKSDNRLSVFNDSNEIHNIEDNPEDDDDDDDQFDEDAVSLEDNCEISLNKDNNDCNEQNCSITKTDNKCNHLDEQDSDRLFLLSLLPYLRKVKEQRKLQVRQKLQDVLIQEFG